MRFTSTRVRLLQDWSFPRIVLVLLGGAARLDFQLRILSWLFWLRRKLSKLTKLFIWKLKERTYGLLWTAGCTWYRPKLSLGYFFKVSMNERRRAMRGAFKKALAFSLGLQKTDSALDVTGKENDLTRIHWPSRACNTKSPYFPLENVALANHQPQVKQ